MNLKYTTVSLGLLINRYMKDQQAVKGILNTFDCLNNLDVDKFLKQKAIIFDKQGLAKTQLVFTSYKEKMVLVGYYTLTMKYLVVKNSAHGDFGYNRLSKSLKKRISKFAQYDKDTRQYIISAPLIGQLGKNDNYRDLISGDVLLEMACNKVKEIQASVGGRVVYIECEDKPILTDFYTKNGFVSFGKRNLEYDEKDGLSGSYLVQMMKYLK